jgi:glucoamylase
MPLELAAGEAAELDIDLVRPELPGHGGDAPGGPGIPTGWAPGRKQGYGVAREAGRLWFALGEGRLGELFWPRVDRPQVKELGFVVTDGATFCLRSTLDTEHTVERLDADAPLYRVTETDPEGRFALHWEVTADPQLDAAYVRVELEVWSGDPAEYRVYAWVDPHLELGGAGDRLTYVEHEGTPLLIGADGVSRLALGMDGPWETFSCGYAGEASDPLADLCAGPPYALDERWRAAGPGNVLGLIGWRGDAGPRVLYIAFGSGPGGGLAAASGARARLAAAGFAGIREELREGWRDWAAGLRDLGPWSLDGGARFRAARQVLAALEDGLFPGAVVTAGGFAWGEDQDDGSGVRPRVRPRDLYRAAEAFLAVDEVSAALRCLEAMEAMQLDEDGAMPLLADVDGYRDDPGDRARQLESVAAPILLVWRLWAEAGALDDEAAADWYARLARPAAEVLRQASPAQSLERWGEEYGWAPASLAWQIAGLVCAAELAESAGDAPAAAAYLARADALESQIEARTYTTTGGLGDGAYYVRVDQTGDPDDAATIELASGAGVYPERDIIDMGFLDLVRLGVRRADDPHVRGSLPEVDAVLRTELPAGAGFHRYNHDGYGEKADGSSYLADPPFTGIGRAWPLLTAERAGYALAAGEDPLPFLAALESFTTEGLLFPEQVWDAEDIPEAGLERGRPSNSACPLAWATAEYLVLLRSLEEGRPFGRLAPVYARYADEPPVILDARATPDRVGNSGTESTLFTVTAEDPDGYVAAVSVDAGELGAGELVLNDDGAAGDEIPGDGVWSRRWTMPGGTPPGEYSLPCRAVDEYGAAAEAVIRLWIVPEHSPTPPPGPTATPGPPSPTATPQPAAPYVELLLSDSLFEAGDRFLLELLLENPAPAREADVYLALEAFGTYYFWPGWTTAVDRGRRTLPAWGESRETILDFTWPEGAGSAQGLHFYALLTHPDTLELWSNVASATFSFR